MGKKFRLIHIYISLFFLPLALLYALSGVLFLTDFGGDSGAKVVNLKLNKPFDDETISSDVKELLEKNSIKLPSNLELKKEKSWFAMGNPKYRVVLKPKGNSVDVKVVDRSILGLMMVLHKGGGKWYFDVLGVGFALAMFALYVSGLIIANLGKIKAQAWGAVGIGFLATLVLGYLSVVY